MKKYFKLFWTLVGVVCCLSLYARHNGISNTYIASVCLNGRHVYDSCAVRYSMLRNPTAKIVVEEYDGIEAKQTDVSVTGFSITFNGNTFVCEGDTLSAEARIAFARVKTGIVIAIDNIKAIDSKTQAGIQVNPFVMGLDYNMAPYKPMPGDGKVCFICEDRIYENQSTIPLTDLLSDKAVIRVTNAANKEEHICKFQLMCGKTQLVCQGNQITESAKEQLQTIASNGQIYIQSIRITAADNTEKAARVPAFTLKVQ